MYYSYVEIEYVATSFSPARTDLALKLLSSQWLGKEGNFHVINLESYSFLFKDMLKCLLPIERKWVTRT